MQVLLFESLGISVRNTKRFFVLNPTNISYDFTWALTATTASGLEGQGGPGGSHTTVAGPFVCTTKKGTIMGGRYVPAESLQIASMCAGQAPFVCMTQAVCTSVAISAH
jgi:hypothetical protein